MQFNFLGGQSQRDTLTQALGQRNPVLDSQLDFAKSAFTTGVQGAGATMRTAMQIGQQERESILRDKTTIREGALQRQQAQDLLTQKLEADDLMFERTSEREDARTKAANEARRLEILGQESRANRAQLDKEARDREEFNRRLGLATADKAAVEAKELDKLNKTVTGELEGFKSRFEGELGLTELEGDEDRFEFNPDGTLKFDADGNPISSKGGKLRDKIRSHFSGIYDQAMKMADPYQRQAFMKQMSGQLSLTNIRGLYDPKFRAEEEKRKADAAARGAASRPDPSVPVGA